ncbi:MAG: hypothetical protein A2070_02015, partial [Bdellovibrionales bacterium GWC1_52_8]
GALEAARRGLERGAEDTAPVPDGKTFPSRVILLITDGEDQEGGATEQAAELNKSDIKLYIIGVGTQKGGPIPMRDADGNLHGYKKDRKGEPVISTFKPDQLTALAAAGGGKYWNATQDEQEIEEMLTDLNALNRTEYTERRYLVHEDRFQFPLAIAVILLFLELAVATSRKPAKLLLVLFIFGSFLPTQPASAESAVPLDSYFENRKGLEAFNDGKIEEAKKHFGAAQAIDPTRPELEFNQGVIRLQEGDVDSAVRSFDQAARLSQSNPQVSGQALYNLGGALSKKGDVPNAIRSYLGAISKAHQAKDFQLGEDARKNLELLIQQQQQKKKQEQQQKDEQDKKEQQEKQKKEKEKEDQKSKENEQKKEKDQKEPKQFEEPKESRKRQFRSPKLSPEDAERVMAELKNREKELHKRLKKQQGTSSGVQKDW